MNNAPRDLHWAIAAEIAADIAAALRRCAQGKRWAGRVSRVQLASLAQAAMTVSAWPVPEPESAKTRRLRLSAARFLRELELARLEGFGGVGDNPEMRDAVAEHFGPAIVQARKFAASRAETPIEHVAARAMEALERANRDGDGPLIPMGFGEGGPVVELVDASLRHTAISASRETIRKALERRYGQGKPPRG